jgi:putative nucleotidyltransferase with HDIG domain
MQARGLTDHAERVAWLTAAVCRRMGLSPRPSEVIVTAALLHDVGKLALPRAVIDRPGRLSDAEAELVRQHAALGARTLRRIPGLAAEALLVLHSHERWDGRGYPSRLRGRGIPLGSRIIAACDAWDAMTNDRPYRTALPRDAALSELLAGGGVQWDDDVVTVLVSELSVRGEV